MNCAWKLVALAVVWLSSIACLAREQNLVAESTFVSAKVGSCAFRFVDFYPRHKGISHFDEQGEYRGQNPYWVDGAFFLYFNCYRTDTDEFQSSAIREYVNRNDAADTWSVAPYGATAEDKNQIEAGLSKEELALLKKGRSGGMLKAINSNGFYVVENQPFGDPAKRIRNFQGCLIRPPQALCVHGEAGNVATPKKSLVPHIVKLLQTVEFVD
jgi:hypothetical protein